MWLFIVISYNDSIESAEATKKTKNGGKMSA